ncbi:unnamed protein product, partial [marine sediment metagenome]
MTDRKGVTVFRNNALARRMSFFALLSKVFS